MFDANARHIRKGGEFFVEVLSVSDKLKCKGVVKGSVVLCKMLNSENRNPCVDILINGKYIAVCDGKNDFWKSLLVYVGQKDLTDFICDKTKNKAKEVLKENT